MGYAATKVLKIVKLGRSTYYYNISNDKKEDKEPKKAGGRSIPGYSYDKSGKKYVMNKLKNL